MAHRLLVKGKSITSRNSASAKPDLRDKEILELALSLYHDDRLMVAARLLRKVQNKRLLKEPQYQEILTKAVQCDKVVQELTTTPIGEWIKQGESHGKYDSSIYYKMDPETNTKLTVRVETPIEPQLLVPLLSVLNETELYPTWLPSWKRPICLGVTHAIKLAQIGRASQVLFVAAEVPWPLSPREVIISACASDDIDENGYICVTLNSIHEGEEGNLKVPEYDTESKKSVIRARVDFEGGFLFRKCPDNHETLLRHKLQTNEKKVLVCFSAYVDGKIQFLPQRIINFVVRTVIGNMWNKFLSVAQEVLVGERQAHSVAIAQKRSELYDWVDERVEDMLSKFIDTETCTSQAMLDNHPENWF